MTTMASIPDKYAFSVGVVPGGFTLGLSMDLVLGMVLEDLCLSLEMALSSQSVPPAEATVPFSDLQAPIGRR